MARPTLYSEEIITKTREYLDACGNKEIIVDVPIFAINEETGEQTILSTKKEVRKKVNLPSIEGLAVFLHISRETIRRWSEEVDPATKEPVKPEFCGIIEELRAKQAEMLINSGLSGEYNSTISKVILTKHGYSDRIDMTSKGDRMPTPIFAAIPSTPNAIPVHNSDAEDSESE